MPVYQIDIEKSLQPTAGVTNYWTNVYYTNAASEAAAITTGQSVVTLEKQIHANNVTFTKMRTRLVSNLAQTGTGATAPNRRFANGMLAFYVDPREQRALNSCCLNEFAASRWTRAVRES